MILRMTARRILFGFACALTLLILPAPQAQAWAHQGHILITRLAARRIIDDPSAPRGLKNFLKTNMPWSFDDCRRLAEEQTVGIDPAAHPEQFDTGLDHWCTMPDQLRTLPEGREPIAPYGANESSMHFLDLEYFSPVRAYKDDLSGKPTLSDIPHDVHDPRFKRAGFVPFRVEECYGKLAAAFGATDAVAHPDDALHWAGYLAHYVQDSTQPHHATMDFKSLTYLAGHVKEIPAAATQPGGSLLALHVGKNIDPHGDLEFQLFENADPPRGQFRQEYWKDMQDDIDQLAAAAPKAEDAGSFDPFRWDLQILGDSYDYLPLIGRAARAAYASGTFDPQAFFTYQGKAHGQDLTILQLIALQNAKAVLHTERAWRSAWRAAHASPPPRDPASGPSVIRVP